MLKVVHEFSHQHSRQQSRATSPSTRSCLQFCLSCAVDQGPRHIKKYDCAIHNTTKNNGRMHNDEDVDSYIDNGLLTLSGPKLFSPDLASITRTITIEKVPRQPRKKLVRSPICNATRESEWSRVKEGLQ